MMRILRMKDVLLSTIHSAQFKEVTKNDVVSAAIKDITDPKYFKAMYILLRAVYPAIRVLRYCDKGEPAMDKLYYLTYRATDAINRSKDYLSDPAIFQFDEDDSLVTSESDIYGTASAVEDDYQIEPEFSDDDEEPQDADHEPDVSDSDSESRAVEEEEESPSLWASISKAWNHRSTKLDHDWAITGWALSVMPEVYKDARARLTGIHRDAIKETNDLPLS
jgi:hypothetical protein